MNGCRPIAGLVALALAIGSPNNLGAEEASAIAVKAFDLPVHSELLRPETIAGLAKDAALWKQAAKNCLIGPVLTKPGVTGEEIRACEAKIYPLILVAALHANRVKIRHNTIAGVAVNIIEPAEPASMRRGQRILMNVHGGSFNLGAHFFGILESVPLATRGYTVVSVDYRTAPEYLYPAARDDVVAVYSHLIKSHRAASVGVFGCSAGAMIVGQAIMSLANQKRSLPGAAVFNCSAPAMPAGDTKFIVAAIKGVEPYIAVAPYFGDAAKDDPFAFPARNSDALRLFPPTLLITTGRDPALSNMFAMSTRLRSLGKPVQLQVYEGLDHADFVYNPYLPEYAEAADLMADFFQRTLQSR